MRSQALFLWRQYWSKLSPCVLSGVRAQSTSAESGTSLFRNRSHFVASQISAAVTNRRNRLFAVVFVNGRQYKVTDGDLIVVEHSFPVDLGERIRMEKVLLVGGRDFTILGRPLLDRNLVTVEATVIEKTTAQPEVDYLKLDGKKVQSTAWKSRELTSLRINAVLVDESQVVST